MAKPLKSKSIAALQTLPEPRVAQYGDFAIYLSYPGEGYRQSVNDAVLDLAARLRNSGDWEDVISGYDSLVASFNPLHMSLTTAANHLDAALKSGLEKKTKPKTGRAPEVIDIPVYYGDENGPDMKALMKSSGLSKSGIIKLHSAEPYRVCMMGFVPGFTFLSEAPKALHHPRHMEPRLSVPAGSIGIAGWQTGIYGLSSPGGWQIIGRTPLKIFDVNREVPFLWQAGDQLRFVAQKGPFPKGTPV